MMKKIMVCLIFVLFIAGKLARQQKIDENTCVNV